MRFPDAALKNHIAVLGKTGSGKTNAAKVLAEMLMDRKQRVCAVDPTGVWWGLRLDRDGKQPGFPVVIFGGPKADIEISEASAGVLAKTIAESDVSAVIDTSLMTVGERTRFFTEFANTLFRANNAPLHLIIDEAHLFAPQARVQSPESGKMLHATNSLVSGGRARGLRITLITQRPAKLHKDSLTQVETLVAMRLLAPQDIGAVKDWIKESADPAKTREFISSLPSFKRGEACVWFPEEDFLDRFTFPLARTFDSSSGPTVGARHKLSPIDLDALRGKLAETIEKAKADDPRELRRQIAELKASLTKQQRAEVDPAAEKAAFQRGLEYGFQTALQGVQPRILACLDSTRKMIAETLDEFGAEQPAVAPAQRPPTYETHVPDVRSNPAPIHTKAPANNGSGARLAGGERKILTALAQYAPKPRTKVQVAMLAGYAHNGGGFNNYLSSLASRGLINRSGPDTISITPQGIAALGHFDPLPTGRALQEYWMAHVDGRAEREILRVLIEAHGMPVTKERVAERAGYEPTGGGFNNALSRLRTLELISGRGELQVNPELL